MPNETMTHWIAPAGMKDEKSSVRRPPIDAVPTSNDAPLSGLRRWAREPLLHFAVIGGLIFAADARLHPPAKDDHVITVTKALRQSFIDNYDEDRERKPSAEELKKTIDAWVASEILYREGKKAGVDRGDEMIRNRIAYKLQLLIFDQVEVASPTEGQLAEWFAQNHARFDEPPTVGFYMTPPTDEATARKQYEDIKAGRESSDLEEKTRAIVGRPVPSLASSFGEGFRDALVSAPLGQWTVLQSKEGWHVVRLDSRHDGIPAQLADKRDEAARIWHDDEVRKQAWEAVNRLKASYQVRIEE